MKSFFEISCPSDLPICLCLPHCRATYEIISYLLLSVNWFFFALSSFVWPPLDLSVCYCISLSLLCQGCFCCLPVLNGHAMPGVCFLPAHYVAYERGKDISTSLLLMIRSSTLHSYHTDRCAEGCLFEAHLSSAFGAPLLQGATRIACNTVLSFLFLRIYSHTSAAKISRLRFC